jgi:hypothetical protein
MKRSILNRYITEAAEFFTENHFVLPPFASWTPEQWRMSGAEATELRAQRLGWDITDFNSGQFKAIGLTMFTLRNGLASTPDNEKPYAEKIMLVRDKQITPFHYHAKKIEDIINRGSESTGKLVVRLYGSSKEGHFSDERITVICDGISRTIESGGQVVLGPGESISLSPHLYHTFYAIDGDALIGEVSSTNNDDIDNFFYEPIGRYPERSANHWFRFAPGESKQEACIGNGITREHDCVSTQVRRNATVEIRSRVHWFGSARVNASPSSGLHLSSVETFAGRGRDAHH